jgi:tRNA-specific 2-thiouridylase
MRSARQERLHMKEKVLVGMSGGVDSSVAAALLIEEGYNVAGITMKIWEGEPGGSAGRHGCYGAGEIHDIEDARQVASLLSIPFHIIDLAKEYRENVLSYFKEEYCLGRTPNPCVRCNHKVKFGHLLGKAAETGLSFDYFATGHYVIKELCEETGRYMLRKGADPRKDQSYFLSFLEQGQLARSLFPLGKMRKDEVRAIAARYSLPVVEKEESQDFIEDGDYTALFDSPPQPGPIVDLEGNELGTHKGIIHYTVGQRRGIGISAKEPLYVISIDRERNTIVVGSAEHLFSQELAASNVNWISISGLNGPMRIKAKIRIAHRESDAMLIPAEAEDQVNVRFSEPQRGITPGQIVVFYQDDTVLGGGIIEKSEEQRQRSGQ